jgi:hypothetical protein
MAFFTSLLFLISCLLILQTPVLPSIVAILLFVFLLACLMNNVVYLKTLSISLTTQRRMMMRLLDKVLKEIWKKSFVAGNLHEETDLNNEQRFNSVVLTFSCFILCIQSIFKCVRTVLKKGIVPSVMRTALFWVITQRVVVIYYRRFETTYRSHIHFFLFMTPEDGIDRTPRNVGKLLPLITDVSGQPIGPTFIFLILDRRGWDR